MQVWALLKPAVLEWLAVQQPKTIAFTGHSLGGALAVLAAYDLAAGWTIEEVTVFGCPRVGTPSFAADYVRRKSGPTSRLTLGEVTTRYGTPLSPVRVRASPHMRAPAYASTGTRFCRGCAG